MMFAYHADVQQPAQYRYKVTSDNARLLLWKRNVSEKRNGAAGAFGIFFENNLGVIHLFGRRLSHIIWG